MQIMMTGFLGKTKAKLFLGELWNSLIEAQNSPHGIPKEMIEMKRTEMVKKKEEDQRINASLHKSRDEIERSLSIRDKQAAQNRKEYQSSVLQRYSPPPASRSSDQRERRPSSRDRKESRKKSISPPPPPPPAAVAPSSRKKSLSPSRRNRNDVDDHDRRKENSRRYDNEKLAGN
jgi:serine/arginine repetitive matrix protein 1